jgi:hypothetical protein
MNPRRRSILLGSAAFAATAPLAAQTPAVRPAPTPTLDFIDIEPVVRAALGALGLAQVAPGRYRRFLGKQQRTRPGGDRASGYGSAAAACILYTAGRFPSSAGERAAFVAFLSAGQDGQSGMFSDQYHRPTHATAYHLAALDLFDAEPAHPLHELGKLNAPGAIEALLDGLDWRKPWGASHEGAGSFAALFLARQATPSFQERYFGWLADQQDPQTGLWRKGSLASAANPDGAQPFDALAAAFHYLFNHEAARRPIPRPAALIDTALQVRRENRYPALGKGVGFAELDWLYCLTRCARQSAHRRAEVVEELSSFARAYARHLLALVQQDGPVFEDLHALNGTMSALAELQQAVPGLLRSERALRLTLDRRPFI